MKMCKNGDFLHISGISARKKFFLKIGLGHILACYYVFLNKESVKTNDEISRKRQKPFSGIFPVFSAGKVCQLKIGLCHILGIGILHQRAKFHEKNIKYGSRNSRNTGFPAKIGCSDDF